VKAKDLALKFRSLIIPAPGRVLLELDFRSFHAVMLAFEARDHAYMRLARMEGGVHSYLAGLMTGHPADISWDDQKLEAHLTWIKSEFRDIRNNKAKQAILGWQQGMESYLLREQCPEIFPKLRDAQETIEIIKQAFPDCDRYRREVIRRAHNQGFLQSRYGYVRWFYEALRRCSKCSKGWTKQSGKWTNPINCLKCKGERLENGDEAKEAAAFENSNDAHGHLKDKVLELAERGLLARARHVNYVHDSLVFEPDYKGWETIANEIAKIMESPNLTLIDEEMAPEGMWVGVEIKISYQSLAKQEIIKL